MTIAPSTMMTLAWIAATVAGLGFILTVVQLVTVSRELRQSTFALSRESSRWRLFLTATPILFIQIFQPFAFTLIRQPGDAGDGGVVLSLYLLLLMMFQPVFLLELPTSTAWPNTGMIRNYQDNLNALSGRRYNWFAKLALPSVEDQNRSGLSRQLVVGSSKALLSWIVKYGLTSISLFHLKYDYKKMRQFIEKEYIRYQITIDVILIVSVYGAVAVVAFTCYLHFTGQSVSDAMSKPGLLSIAPAIICAAAAVALLVGRRTLPVETSVWASYVPKELAETMARHRLNTAAPERRKADGRKAPNQLTRLQRRLDRMILFNLLAMVPTALVGLWALVPAPSRSSDLEVGLQLLIVAAALLYSGFLVFRIQDEMAEQWERVGLAVGSRLPLHFVRSMGHRATNSIEPSVYSLKRIAEWLAELGPDADGKIGVKADDVDFHRGTTEDGIRGLQRLLEWFGALRERARDLRSDFDLWLDPKRQRWVRMGTLIDHVEQQAEAFREREKQPSGAPIDFGILFESPSVDGTHQSNDPNNIEIWVDDGTLTDILSNVIRNGFNAVFDKMLASPDSSTNPEVLVRVSYFRGSLSPITITVRDNGIGVPQDLRDQIFEPYVSSKGTMGSGLGLFVARDYMRTIGGAISFTTSQKPGHSFTEFTISLPYTRVRDAGSDGVAA